MLGKGGMGTFDQSAPLMVLVIKLSSFGWCVYDGHRKVGGNTEASKSTGDLSPLQQRLAISPSSFPSLVEYMGYVFFFGGFLVGPAFEFSDYIRFINGEAPFEVEKMPSRVLPTLKCIVWALLCMGIFAMFSKRYNLALLVGGGGEDEGLVFSNSISRFAFIIVASAVARAKFYGAWKMSEGACVLAGVGYAGEGKWNRVENIRILDFELPENPKALSDSWNINTSLWLRNYVYVRVTGILGNGWGKPRSDRGGPRVREKDVTPHPHPLPLFFSSSICYKHDIGVLARLSSGLLHVFWFGFLFHHGGKIGKEAYPAAFP